MDARERPPGFDSAEAHVARLESLGARVVEGDVPDPDGDTWAVFFHEAATSHTATYPARAEDYGENVRRKLELAQPYLDPARAADAYGAIDRWRGLEPDVDLYVSPVLAGDLPAEDCDELEERLTLSAFSASVQPARLGCARDRRPAADRPARRDGARGRACVGARMIRPATPAYLPAVHALFARSAAALDEPALSIASLEAEWAAPGFDPALDHWLAERDGDVVGYAALKADGGVVLRGEAPELLPLGSPARRSVATRSCTPP